MPASGWIKIKQWNDVAYTSGALTGIGATATGADVVGWIELVGDEAGTLTISRLSTFTMLGDWFLLGTTDGTRATTYQIPSNGTLVYHAGVWVETGSSTDIYEFYPCAGSRAALIANIQTDAVRGKFCWISTAGLLRFGHDGTNSTGGYIPPSGRRIRIPNIFTANCTTAARTANVLPNATLATRFEFATTGGGPVDIRQASINWYLNLSQPYDVYMENVGVLTSLLINECASSITLDNVGIGQEAANSQTSLTLTYCRAGATITDCTITRAAQASSGYVCSVSDSADFTIDNLKIISLTKAANATTGSLSLTRLNNSTFTNTLLGGGRAAIFSCKDLTFETTSYFDNINGTTGTAIPQYAFDLSLSCSNILIDGIDFAGLTLVQPYTGILNVGAAGCENIKLRNLGTYASPLNMGGAASTQNWTRVTTTASVTHTAHGLKVGDIIYVLISSDTVAIIVGAKTIASVGTPDTFTFTCLNAGSLSGTIYYYPVMTSVLITLTACTDVKIQRCYVPGLRTGLYSGDNTASKVTFESVFGNLPLTAGMLLLNTKAKGFNQAQNLSAQTAIYGTTFIDSAVTGVPANTTSQAWTRSTTTATVTSNNHNMRTGDVISVTSSDSEAAITLGAKTITATTVNTFTFTCLNAGATSGNLSYVAANSRIGIVCNEKTSITDDLYVVDTDPASFTSAGTLYMPTINGQITFETPYYILGHNSFPNVESTMVGGGAQTNFDITYSIDTGSGYSSYKNLSYPRAGGGGTNGSTNVTMTSTTGVNVDDYIYGTNIGGGAKVVSITNSTTIVASKANIGTVSGILRFNQLPSEPTLPSTGIKLKIRFKTTTTNTTAITSFSIPTNSNDTTRAYQYTLDTVSITLTGLKSGSEVRVYEDSGGLNGDELAGIESSGTSFTFECPANTTVNMMINHLNYLPADIWGYVVETEDVSIPVSQFVDRQFLNP